MVARKYADGCGGLFTRRKQIERAWSGVVANSNAIVLGSSYEYVVAIACQ
jgi:hypothetical protein